MLKYYLWVFIGLFSLAWENDALANASDSTVLSNSEPEIRLLEFDQSLLENIRADNEFQYIQPPEVRPNFLKMLFDKFFEWLVYVLGNEFIAWLVLFVIIIIGLVGLGFAFYGIFGIGKTIPVYGGDPGALNYKVIEENIHEMNFNEEIDLAVRGGNYKQAIRLIYLFSLKLLTDRQIIDWQPAKTNQDYVYEIKDAHFQDHFKSLGYYYEYVWYGDFHADKSHYLLMNTSLSELKKNLSGRA